MEKKNKYVHYRPRPLAVKEWRFCDDGDCVTEIRSPFSRCKSHFLYADAYKYNLGKLYIERAYQSKVQDKPSSCKIL